MNTPSQIRLEQEALMAAPPKPYQRLVQTVSNVFHPLLTLTYTALVICLYTHLCASPLAVQAFFVGEVFFYTMVMPALIITLLHVFHVIGHWALRDVRDRTIPFFTNFVCYLTNYIVLRYQGFVPTWVLTPYFGAVVLTFVAWIISFWWKISAHASANAAAAAYFVYLYYMLPTFFPQWLPIAGIIVVGCVCSTRVYLERHTLAQVGAGTLLGIVSMLIAINS